MEGKSGMLPVEDVVEMVDVVRGLLERVESSDSSSQ